MKGIELQYLTGIKQADNILEGLVEMTEILIPSTIGSIYLTGSYAFDAAVSTSDIDLFFVGRPNQLDDEMKDKIFLLSQLSPLICSLRLDVKAYQHAELVELDSAVDGSFTPVKAQLHFNAVTVKIASRLIYGTDIRHQICLPPMARYIDNIVGYTMWVIDALRGEGDDLRLPLEYPNPEAQFYGYVIDEKLEQLVYIVGLIASTRIAQAANENVTHKQECPHLYRQYVGDGFSDFVDEVFHWCRDQWEYRIPDNPTDRIRLIEICKHTLDFENLLLASSKGHQFQS